MEYFFFSDRDFFLDKVSALCYHDINMVMTNASPMKKGEGKIMGYFDSAERFIDPDLDRAIDDEFETMPMLETVRYHIRKEPQTIRREAMTLIEVLFNDPDCDEYSALEVDADELCDGAVAPNREAIGDHLAPAIIGLARAMLKLRSAVRG